MFEQQGRVARIWVPRDPSRGSVGGRRGKITRYTSASRRRMFDMLNRFDWAVELALGVMSICLTYHDDWPVSPGQQWRELYEFCRRMGFRWVVWRREWQKRGAVHWHLIVGGCASRGRVLGTWCEVTGDPTITEVHVSTVGCVRQLINYVSKHHAKVDEEQMKSGEGPSAAEGSPGPSLTTSAYSENGGSIGRIWGLIGRQNVVWCELIWLVLTGGSWLKRARRVFRRLTGVKTRCGVGFTAFQEPGTWEKYVMWLVGLGETEVVSCSRGAV